MASPPAAEPKVESPPDYDTLVPKRMERAVVHDLEAWAAINSQREWR